MPQHHIHLQPLGKTISANHGTPLIDVLHEYGIEFPCGGKGTCGKCKVKLLEGEIETSGLHKQKLADLQLSDSWRLACFSTVTSDITLEIHQYQHLILADESEFEFAPQTGFGVAVDVGTTTLVAQLVDLSTAKVLAVETMINPQAAYGADLISRIHACLDGNAARLTLLIRQAIGRMIELLLQKQHIRITRISMVGNTVMQLIFSGCDLSPLAQYPFDADDIGLKEFDCATLGWGFTTVEKVRFFPAIGSFVGSDILAGILATGLHTREKCTALIDLGTNGEIVVGNKQSIVCASTAAGPAFEGTNISIGMRAVTGAVSSVELENDSLKLHVIGNTAPKGICGSALIDAVAAFRKLQRIGDFGEILSGETSLSLTPGIELTQKDINEFQLAKAAIAAGLHILCKSLSVNLSDIQEVYIAGGFGTYITIPNLIETGMIQLPEERIHKRGNTALTGAKMLLFAEGKTLTDILSKTQHINLEIDPEFQDIYVDHMLF